MVKNSLRKQLESLSPGDLICGEWCDASTGKSSSNGGVIDVPVRSWGVFVGLFGRQNQTYRVGAEQFPVR